MLAGRRPDRARRCSRPPPPTASPASPRSPPTRSSRRSPPTRGSPRRSLAAAPAPVPAPVADGTARVDAGNTAWNPATERLEPRFAFPATRPTPGCCRRGEGRRRAEHPRRALAPRPRRRQPGRPLRQPRPRPFPRSTPPRIRSSPPSPTPPPPAPPTSTTGSTTALLFDRPTFGNSSTAITGGALWRSLPRYAMTQPDGTGPLRLWQNAATNQLYVYPVAQGLRRQDRRPLPGQHPLSPGLARLLGLRQALPRRHRADPRRLPPRHQGAAGGRRI